jgi:deoxyribodipyrimidine photo-lyase
MRRQFENRQDLIDYVRSRFPQATDPEHISERLGGRQAAEVVLQKINPVDYARSRNFLNGAVTYLSAYIRYGVLSLAEVRDAVLKSIPDTEADNKLITELAWRDYWQRLYVVLGDRIWQDQEPYKTGFAAQYYHSDLPEDIATGQTGMVCIDQFSDQLRSTGYLHNHIRMWLAAYIVHWRRVQWQAGARWFLEHLLDGDPASNNLSWQWVASTFSHKPYFFNRENLERYSQGQYCRSCPLYGCCDFEGSYEEISDRLFPNADFQKQDASGSYGHRPNKTNRRRK